MRKDYQAQAVEPSAVRKEQTLQERVEALEDQVKALQQAQPYRYICLSCGDHVKDIQMHGCRATGQPSFRLM